MPGAISHTVLSNGCRLFSPRAHVRPPDAPILRSSTGPPGPDPGAESSLPVGDSEHAILGLHSVLNGPIVGSPPGDVELPQFTTRTRIVMSLLWALHYPLALANFSRSPCSWDGLYGVSTTDLSYRFWIKVNHFQWLFESLPHHVATIKLSSIDIFP